MSEFALNAVNWETVDVLGVEHLEAERLSLEELIRCGVGYGGVSGVIRLDDADLIASSNTSDPSQMDLTVRLLQCRAITPKGYLVSISPEDAEEEEGLVCTLERFAETYLWVGVGEMQGYPGLGNEAGVRKRRYRLATQDQKQSGEECLDWLTIGRIGRNGGTLGLDNEFIPECVYLDSHPVLWRKVEAIQGCAEAGYQVLYDQARAGQFHSEAFAHPLSIAMTVIETNLSPRLYLERLISVLKTLTLLQFRLPEGPARSRLQERIKLALDYAMPHLNVRSFDWSKSLDLIRAAFCELESALKSVRGVRRESVPLPDETILNQNDEPIHSSPKPEPEATQSPWGRRFGR